MDDNMKLGRILGVPIGLHWSWFLIFIMVTWSLVAGVFSVQMPGLSRGLYWGLATMTSLVLFGSVLAHEMGHAVISIRNQIAVRRITLFIFGGIAQIEHEPQRPGIEFRIAIAGPVVSLLLAAFFGAIYWFGRSIPLLATPAGWLAQVNLTLVLFNMIPGFPLDGGRVLRSILWAVTKSYRKATRIATYTGQVIGFAFIAVGIYTVTRGSFTDGLWLMFIGWFLNSAASASREQSERHPGIDNIRVNQVMDRRVTDVSSDITLDRLVSEKIVLGGHRSFLVKQDNRPIGLITIRDIIQVPRSEWGFTQAGQIMRPWSKLVQVSSDRDLNSVLEEMELRNQAQVPVIEHNQVAGLLSREQILRYVWSRSELNTNVEH